jgi:hypothetical protein
VGGLAVAFLTFACRAPRPIEAAPAAVPAVVLESTASAAATVPCRDAEGRTSSARRCPAPTRLSVVLVDPRGLAAPESLQVALEPQRRWDEPRVEARVRRGRFRGLGAPGRAGAAFESVEPGRYLVRLGRPGGETMLWRVVLVPGCWSRLEVWVDARAAENALAPSAATLYSCSDER